MIVKCLISNTTFTGDVKSCENGWTTLVAKNKSTFTWHESNMTVIRL